MKKILIMIGLCFSSLVAVDIGDVPKNITLSSDEGGLVAGGVWDSSMIKDKVYVLFYVDPDEKDVNEAFADALKKEDFDKSKYGTMAIINLAATWKPNMIINALLKSKQKKFPNAMYIKDKNKKLVKEWGLQDDSSDILVFDKDGKLLYSRAGKLDDTEITNVIALIKAHL